MKSMRNKKKQTNTNQLTVKQNLHLISVCQVLESVISGPSSENTYSVDQLAFLLIVLRILFFSHSISFNSSPVGLKLGPSRL